MTSITTTNINGSVLLGAVINAVADAMGHDESQKRRYFHKLQGQFILDAGTMTIKLSLALGMTKSQLYKALQHHPDNISEGGLTSRYYRFYSAYRPHSHFKSKFDCACDLLEKLFGEGFRKEAVL